MQQNIQANPESSPNGRGRWLLGMVGVMGILFVAFNVVLFLSSPVAPAVQNQGLTSTEQAGNLIANAIATPPAPVPGWLSFLYPWQALESAVFALLAALVGAWALITQADASQQGIREQIAAGALADKKRYEREEMLAAQQASDRRRNVAGAISSELRTWLDRLGDRQLLEIFWQQLKTAEAGNPPIVPKVPIYVDGFPIYDAVCAHVALFEGMIPVNIVSAYGALQGILHAFRGIRSGDYDFLNEKLPADQVNAAVQLKLDESKARRAVYGLEEIVRDLDIFRKIARPLVDDLNKIHGNDLPPARDWGGPVDLDP